MFFARQTDISGNSYSSSLVFLNLQRMNERALLNNSFNNGRSSTSRPLAQSLRMSCGNCDLPGKTGNDGLWPVFVVAGPLNNQGMTRLNGKSHAQISPTRNSYIRFLQQAGADPKLPFLDEMSKQHQGRYFYPYITIWLTTLPGFMLRSRGQLNLGRRSH
jgi:hypothetical protein